MCIWEFTICVVNGEVTLISIHKCSCKNKINMAQNQAYLHAKIYQSFEHLQI